MICKFLKYLQNLFDNMLINLFFPFSFSTSESKLNQIIEDIEKNRHEIELYVKNNDPLTSHFCSLRHTTCASNDPLLVWAKDYDHRYITANDTHLKVFYDKTLYQLEDLVGNTDMELIEEYRSNGYEHTFGE